MNINPVTTCTFIIRSQVEYSIAAQDLIVRCLLEKSATGQRRGFTDVDALLTVLRAELLELQNQMIPPEQKNLQKPDAIVADDATTNPGPLIADDTPDPSQTMGSAEGIAICDSQLPQPCRAHGIGSNACEFVVVRDRSV